MQNAKNMKKLMLVLTSVCLAGCVTLAPVDQAMIANHVGFDLGIIVLKNHPEARTKIFIAAASLEKLTAEPNITGLKIVEILQALPISQSTDVQLTLDGAMVIISVVGNPTIKTDKADAIRVIAHNLALGLQRSMQ